MSVGVSSTDGAVGTAAPVIARGVRAGRLLLAAYFPRVLTLEGVGTLLDGVATGLAEAGCSVTVLGPCAPGATPDPGGQPEPGLTGVRRAGYRTGPLGLVRYLRAVRRCSATVDGVILFENNPNMAVTSRWVAAGVPALSYFYTPLLGWGAWREMGWSLQGWKHALAKMHWVSRCAGPPRQRRVVVASEFQARQLRVWRDACVSVVPGSSWSRQARVPTRTEARARLGWPADGFVAGYLGHFSPAKGVGNLVLAWAQVRQPGARLALAHSGKGILPRQAAGVLAELESSGDVSRLGVTEPSLFLAACDLVVLPYTTSSIHHLPQVMLESFAVGKAVLTTRVGGIGDFVEKHQAGHTVAPRQVESLAAALRDCVAAPGRCAEEGARARRLFETTLCREEFCRRLLHCLMPDPHAAPAAAMRCGT